VRADDDLDGDGIPNVVDLDINPLFPASGRLPAFSTAFTPKANS
jgi:hypothetical protein